MITLPISLKKLRMAFLDTAFSKTVIPSKVEVDKHSKRPKIRCPRCGWQPDGRPYWQCEKCFAIFDTFKTHAHCPNSQCGNSWTRTYCIACRAMSNHEDWYESEE